MSPLREPPQPAQVLRPQGILEPQLEAQGLDGGVIDRVAGHARADDLPHRVAGGHVRDEEHHEGRQKNGDHQGRRSPGEEQHHAGPCAFGCPQVRARQDPDLAVSARST